MSALLSCLVVSLTLTIDVNTSHIVAPPVTIGHIHEHPLEIALAWQTSSTHGAVLRPPLHRISQCWTGDGLAGPGRVLLGDRIEQGMLSNQGTSTILVVGADGSLLRIPPGEHLWIGDARHLNPTHRCLCICLCGRDEIAFDCPGGACLVNGIDCVDFSGARRRLRDCRSVYAPLPTDVTRSP